jgi:DNA-binding LacI/PurR family transcriptional regulator
LIVSDRRKRVTIKDVVLAAGVSTQTVSRVMNKSYVSGEIHQCAKAVVEQCDIPKSFYLSSLTTISQDFHSFGRRTVQNTTGIIKARQENRSVHYASKVYTTVESESKGGETIGEYTT